MGFLPGWQLVNLVATDFLHRFILPGCETYAAVVQLGGRFGEQPVTPRPGQDKQSIIIANSIKIWCRTRFAKLVYTKPLLKQTGRVGDVFGGNAYFANTLKKLIERQIGIVQGQVSAGDKFKQVTRFRASG
jgi:hypothetical protein